MLLQGLQTVDRPMTARTLVQLAQYMDAFLSLCHNRLIGMLRKELEPGLSISRHSRDVFLNFLHFARVCTAVVRQRQVSEQLRPPTTAILVDCCIQPPPHLCCMPDTMPRDLY